MRYPGPKKPKVLRQMRAFDKRSNDLDENAEPRVGSNKSHGSVEPIGKITEAGAQVAIILPVVTRDTAEDVEPEYAINVAEVVHCPDGVQVKGVRSRFNFKLMRRERPIPGEPPSAGDYAHASRPRGTEADQVEDRARSDVIQTGAGSAGYPPEE
ncbi:MAG: hypothetical protein Q9166_003655 [cf. Caloplaca sp. 2 TL-2023]